MTNEFIHKTENRVQALKTDSWSPRGVGRGGWIAKVGEFGISRCRLLHTEWINKVLLFSTGTIFNILR